METECYRSVDEFADKYAVSVYLASKGFGITRRFAHFVNRTSTSRLYAYPD
jgi:hypothetical protein